MLFIRGWAGATEQTSFALLLEAVALAFDVEGGGIVQETVKNSGGEDMIVESLTPIQVDLVAGDDQTGALIAAHNQAEEQGGFVL